MNVLVETVELAVQQFFLIFHLINEKTQLILTLLS